jgi:hypothetical protein
MATTPQEIERRNKISQTMKGRKPSSYCLERARTARKGMKFPESWCKRLSESHMGQVPYNKGKSRGYLLNGYLAYKINNQIYFEHHLIWELHYGPIPSGYVIHHKNGNKVDNRIENLEMMTISKHSLLHWRLRKGE